MQHPFLGRIEADERRGLVVVEGADGAGAEVERAGLEVDALADESGLEEGVPVAARGAERVGREGGSIDGEHEYDCRVADDVLVERGNRESSEDIAAAVCEALSA